MSAPETVLLDEPSMGLAPQLVEEIFGIVKALNEKEGVSFLLAEQNTNVALRFAHYGYICLLYTSPSPRDRSLSRMPSSA